MVKDILYIEDNPANALLMSKLMSRIPDYILHEADCAEVGIEMLAGSLRPDIILMDIGLPGIDGFEAVKQIRARFDFAKELPIIAVTAEAMPDHLAKGLQADFFEYIVKPIDFTQLLAAIEMASMQ